MNKSVYVEKKATPAFHDLLKSWGKPGVAVQPYHPMLQTLVSDIISGVAYIFGFESESSSSPNKIVIGGKWACEWDRSTNAATFYFNRTSDALLFKLTWGGRA